MPVCQVPHLASLTIPDLSAWQAIARASIFKGLIVSSPFTLTVQDTGIQSALQALSDRLNNMKPWLDAIGEDIVERAKHRFDTSTGPDGQAWKPNADATLEMVAERIGKYSSKVRKNGALNARGRRELQNKKPLIGESKDLMRQIEHLASGSSVTIISNPKYAAIQQFGGQAGRGHKVTIPARPFLPVHVDGTLYAGEKELILDYLNTWIESANRR